MKKSKLVGLTVCALFLCALFWAIPAIITYKQACSLMAQERWNEASSLLGNYEIFEDLSSYCWARHLLKDGDPLGAQSMLSGVSASFRPEEVAQLRREIEAAMPAYRERERQKEEQRLLEEKAKAIYGVPYVGMDEDWIDITSLGAHDELRQDRETKNGKIYWANHYEFHDSSGRKIFSARCLFGEVIQVWDYRDDPRKEISYTPTDDSDPYDAKDYSNPEDFYDDHYYDFFYYEDAEDYYYEHRD